MGKIKKEKEKTQRIREISREQWDLAHLQLEETPENLPNPFLDEVDEYYLSHPDEHLLSIMMDPQNFGWTASKLFNTADNPDGLQLFPQQCVILKELWQRSFPILIGSRGLGKSYLLAVYSMLRALFIPGRKIVITGAGFRQSKIVLAYAEQLWNNSPVFRDICGAKYDKMQGVHHSPDVHWIQVGASTIKAIPIGDGCCKSNTQLNLRQLGFNTIGQLHGDKKENINHNLDVWSFNGFKNSDEYYYNGIKPTKRIRTNKGFSFEATYNHALKIIRNGKIGWVRMDEMIVGDNILIDRSYRWHDTNNGLSIDDAYALGLLTGDGSWCIEGRIGYSSKDRELSDCVRNFLKKCPNSKARLNWAGMNDPHHYVACSKELRNWLINTYELVGQKTITKEFPLSVLKSSRESTRAYISGLFDTDGTLQVSTAKGGTGITVSFTNTSERLVDQLQFILLHYGIISRKNYRDRNEKWNRVYELYITGQDVLKFHQQIGFKLKRKNDLLEAGLNAKKRNYTNGDFIPDIQLDMLAISKLKRKKRGMFADQALVPSKIQNLKGITHNFVYRFLETYSFTNDPRLEKIRELANPDIFYDEIILIEDSEAETYDIHVPQGNEYCANGFFSHNSKIRGTRAHDILVDEFSAAQPHIFEEVIAGFGVVNIDPISQVKHYQRMEYLKNSKQEFAEEIKGEDTLIMPNQIILSGTASFAFNHFHKYWKNYKNIILSRGDKRKMEKLGIDPNLDYKKYSVIRIPVTFLPKGFMDQDQIDRAKSNQASGIYQNEFEACFTDDSSGFYLRSILEKATPNFRSPVLTPSGNIVEVFSGLLRGDPKYQYVMAIDTAFQRDNFAVVVLELHPDHSRIVHVWTTNKKEHESLKKDGGTAEKDFYAYCVRKIRNFMKLFNIVHIAMDSQGGGRTISELLHNEKYIEFGEQAIWELDRTSPLWDGSENPTDAEPGLHILEMVNFANGKYTLDANHGMKNDFEQRALLFPYSDSIELVLAGKIDSDAGRLYDTLEEVLVEVEELKRELTMIIHDETQSGRERWGAPKVKGSSTVGDLTDDRYSALLMANFAARRLRNVVKQEVEYAHGGFVGQGEYATPVPLNQTPNHMIFPADATKSQPFYVGPAWLTRDMNEAVSGYGLVERSSV